MKDGLPEDIVYIHGYNINPFDNPFSNTNNHINSHTDIIYRPINPSFTPTTTTARLVSPSSTPAPPASPVNVDEGTHVHGRLHIQFDGKELEPSGKCAYIIRKTFVDRVDPNGHKWVTISEEIKEFYWEEFQKKNAIGMLKMVSPSKLLGNM